MSRPTELMPAPTRRSLPVTLPGATEYSADPTLNAPLSLIGRIKGLGYRYTRLRDAVRTDHNWGPKRSQGDWALVMFEFTVSGMVDIQPWYSQRYENTSFWKGCGFTTRPSYSLVHQRLTELEPYACEFQQLAADLIRVAASKDPNVGAWLHVDGTECETHAAAHHDCRPGDDCPDPTLKQFQRLDTPGARHIRHKQTVEPTDAEPTDDVDNDVDIDERGGKRFPSGGHWWYSRDATAGRRAYKRDGKVTRSWDGHYLIAVTDHYTGAMLSGHIQPANVQEVEGYAPSLQRVQAALGRTPIAVVADRGFHHHKIFESNTRQGIASVIPYRRHGHNQPDRPPATDRWDEQGVPICQHCGGGTDQVSFFPDRGMPRQRYRCTLPQTPGCHKDQYINCAHDYKRLLPIWETHETYAILREAHPEYERIHHHNRRRYRIGPDCLELRPKRIGAAWQQLRVSAAIVIEWLRVCFRQGWIGKSGRQQEPRQRTSKTVFQQTLKARAKLGRWGGGIAGRRSRAGPAPPG